LQQPRSDKNGKRRLTLPACLDASGQSGAIKPQQPKPGKPRRKDEMKKETIMQALRAFVNQRSGIEFANYQSGDWKASRAAFMGDYRPILQAGRDARVLLAAVSGRDGITAENIVESCRAYCGRLQFVAKDDSVAVDYTTGQYFPTEYRNAACAVLATALWSYAAAQGYQTGNDIRKWARNEFGRGIASRWFN